MFVITCMFHAVYAKRFNLGRKDPMKFFAKYGATLPAQIKVQKRVDPKAPEITVTSHFVCNSALAARNHLLYWFVTLLGTDVQYDGKDMYTRELLVRDHLMGPDWEKSKTVGIAGEACGYTIVEFPDHAASTLGEHLLGLDTKVFGDKAVGTFTCTTEFDDVPLDKERKARSGT